LSTIFLLFCSSPFFPFSFCSCCHCLCQLDACSLLILLGPVHLAYPFNLLLC
jgi:hypothetical protein